MAQGAGWWQASDHKWYPPVVNSPYGAPPYGAAPSGPPPYGASPYAASPYAAAPYPEAPHPGYQSPYQPYPQAARSTNGLAIASMVLGILWIYWLGSLLALVFGYIALRQIKQRNQAGRGMAIAGTVLGWCGVAFLVLAIIGAVVSHPR
jgi:hypothetical protein